MAIRHLDLDCGNALADEVARLVGGATCKAARGLSHKDQVNLLYHSAFKFSRGETTSKAMPKSVADQLRRAKILGLILLGGSLLFGYIVISVNV